MLNKKSFLLKLARMVIKFGETRTDNGILIYEGELEVGQDVFIEQDGELIPAPGGDYVTEDGTIITVEGGKIESITEPDGDEETETETEIETETNSIENEEVENPTDDKSETDNEAIVEIRKEVNELYARINELEEIIKNKDLEIEKLNSHIQEFTKPAVEEVEDKKEVKKQIFKYIKF